MVSLLLIKNKCLKCYENTSKQKWGYYEYTLLAKYIVSTKVQHGQALLVWINLMYMYISFWEPSKLIIFTTDYILLIVFNSLNRNIKFVLLKSSFDKNHIFLQNSCSLHSLTWLDKLFGLLRDDPRRPKRGWNSSSVIHCYCIESFSGLSTVHCTKHHKMYYLWKLIQRLNYIFKMINEKDSKQTYKVNIHWKSRSN